MKRNILILSFLTVAIFGCKDRVNSKTNNEESKTNSQTAPVPDKVTPSTGGQTVPLPDQNQTQAQSSSVSSWTDANRQTYLQSCTASAKDNMGDKAQGFCQCSLEKLELLYPNPIDVSKLTDAQKTAVATECLQ